LVWGAGATREGVGRAARCTCRTSEFRFAREARVDDRLAANQAVGHNETIRNTPGIVPQGVLFARHDVNFKRLQVFMFLRGADRR